MDLNAIAYAIYQDYMGKKSSILDSACLAKASVDKMKEDEKVYSLISIMRLYLFAGFAPIFEDVSSKVIVLRRGEGEDLLFDLPTYDSEKERVEELINALSMQPELDNVGDRKLAIFKELQTYYGCGKEFTTMLNNYLAGNNVSTKVIERAIDVCGKFLDQYSENMQEDKSSDNMVNVVISETKEDLEEIVAMRNSK